MSKPESIWELKEPSISIFLFFICPFIKIGKLPFVVLALTPHFCKYSISGAIGRLSNVPAPITSVSCEINVATNENIRKHKPDSPTYILRFSLSKKA